MTTQGLSLRLHNLLQAHKQTTHLITRLSKLPIQPGSLVADPSGGDARLELSEEIHQSLKEQEEELELIRQEVEDLTDTTNWASGRRRDSERDREKDILAAQVARFGEDLKTSRSQFRRAQLQAKRNAEAAKRKERELLFAGTQAGTGATPLARKKGQAKLSQADLELNASNEVTAALRRVYQSVESELQRSQFAQDTLRQSTAALASLSESYSNLDTLLASSKSLVSTLIHSQKSDTWYLETAFSILVATILWLLFRRLIWGPASWSFFLFIKLPYRILNYTLRIILYAIASFAGAISGANQSTALSQASQRISPTTPLIVQPSATGGIPRFRPGMSAPSHAVGAGGVGAKAQSSGTEAEQLSEGGGDSLSEKIGHMAEKAREEHPVDHGTVLREHTEEEKPNRKKRMWEESASRPNAVERPRDEL